jgi:2-hydroxychromene-2-carboxylate isomerase
MTDVKVTFEPSPELEFEFEFGSNYSYLSVMRIEDEARRRGVRIVWKPFLLGPIFRALGMESSPFVLQKEKGVYVWQDMARQCRKYGLRWTQPSAFPRLGVLASRIALLAGEQPWIGAFCRAVMELNFVLDQDINEPDGLARILTELGLPASDILDQARAEPTKALLRQQTDQARAKGIFGAPTFFVGTEMFWGNDRLDDALLFASDRKLRASRSPAPSPSLNLEEIVNDKLTVSRMAGRRVFPCRSPIISAARRMQDSFGPMIRGPRAANFKFRSFSS